GRDGQGNPVIKYGFTLKQWFVNRGTKWDNYPNTLSWCNRTGYRLVKIKDITNAKHVVRSDVIIPSATPTSDFFLYMRYIGAGFSSEWGRVNNISDIGFTPINHWIWTSDSDGNGPFIVNITNGGVDWYNNSYTYGLCTYP
ncbi:hypothetical protein J3U09_10965, partial [Gilliamella sp. B2889]|uniref:hypothetical protein n=1 Tax=Gilliamella sp. B2889 TaxID=2817985 RepID=UPI00226A2B76